MANNLFVGGFPYETTQDDLAKLFSAAARWRASRSSWSARRGVPEGWPSSRCRPTRGAGRDRQARRLHFGLAHDFRQRGASERRRRRAGGQARLHGAALRKGPPQAGRGRPPAAGEGRREGGFGDKKPWEKKTWGDKPAYGKKPWEKRPASEAKAARCPRPARGGFAGRGPLFPRLLAVSGLVAPSLLFPGLLVAEPALATALARGGGAPAACLRRSFPERRSMKPGLAAGAAAPSFGRASLTKIVREPKWSRRAWRSRPAPRVGRHLDEGQPSGTPRLALQEDLDARTVPQAENSFARSSWVVS